MTDQNRWALRDLLAAASPGPWEYRASLVSTHPARVLGTFHSSADGEFAAAARQAVPVLLAEIDRLSRSSEALEDIAAVELEDFADRGDAAVAMQNIAERALRR